MLKYDDVWVYPLWMWIGGKNIQQERRKGGKPKPGKIHNIMTFNLTLISFLPPTCFYIFIIQFDNTIKCWTFVLSHRTKISNWISLSKNIDGEIASAISMRNFWIVRKFLFWLLSYVFSILFDTWARKNTRKCQVQ